MPIEIACAQCGKKYRINEDKAGKKFRCKQCESLILVPVAPAAGGQEISPGGSQLLRHQERTVPFELATGDSESIEAISDHIEQHIGPVETVFHEIVSDLVHIDVHVVLPTSDDPFYTLITSGMSDAPMTVPDGCEDYRYAELLLRLPRDWKMTEKAFKNENHYWPIRLLKTLARLPHEYDTWLGFGHTIPNGDPAEPYASGTKLSCALILPMLNVPKEFQSLVISEDKTINFWGVYPLYPEETQHKLVSGTDSLLALFEKHAVSEVIDIQRRNVCRKSWWPFG